MKYGCCRHVAVLILIHLCFCSSLSAKSSLDEYVIVTSAMNKRDIFAAEQLQKYIEQITAVRIPIMNTPDRLSKRIFIGRNAYTEKRLAARNISLSESGAFCYFSDENSDVVMVGKGSNGTIYAVYSFLEYELGCRWFSPDFELVPRRNDVSFRNLFKVETPGIKYRYVMYKHAYDPIWCLKVKNNGTRVFWGNHTFEKFVPLDTYYPLHPEYFSLINGKRSGFNSQLCLSNSELVGLVSTSLEKYIEQNPNHLIYDVSQYDNINYCRCPKCEALANKYGGQSGLMLYFVNQVAREIKKKYPDKLIGTFAYKYTRKPPVGIVPDSNVVVRLCNIECCFSHTMASCERNRSFVDDLQAWSLITDKIFIWDYVTNFSEYCIPNPNFAVLQSNIQLFQKNSVIGILEEGNYQGLGGEFAELRAYLLAKLLWNPELNADVVVNDFMKGYYGNAWKAVREYYDLLLSIAGDSNHLGIHYSFDDKVFTLNFIFSAKKILSKALGLTLDPIIRKHLEHAMMPVCMLELETLPWLAKSDGTVELVKKVIENEGIDFLYETFDEKPNAMDYLNYRLR